MEKFKLPLYHPTGTEYNMIKEFTEKDLKYIIDKQFKICGYNTKYEDIKDNIDRRDDYKCTEQQSIKWSKFLLKYLSDYVPKGRLRRDVSYFRIMYGLYF